ncbi:MAG: hypothetical protein ACTHMC_23945 [Pseudobacter sp.]|uniref:hypothetical protein n=1 Tax=Pseudobacter sp. TaxID=2045420 RepID=UPI003F805BFF
MNIRTEIAEHNRLFLWGIFILYLVLAAWGISRHELWGDEIHAWNIAKGSNHLCQLFRSTRYEGHPPLWHLLLFILSRFTADPWFMQALHFVIAALVCRMLVFGSPFSFLTKLLLPFGYFFLYEYGVLSRNYSLAILLIFLLLAVIRRRGATYQWLYFLPLFILSFTHIYGIFMAVSLHLYYMLLLRERKMFRWLTACAGLVLLLPAVWFVFPPPEGETNLQFFLSRWEFSQAVVSIQAPLRAWVPVVAWWEPHCWNTEFVLQWQQEWRWLRFGTPFISIGILLLAGSVLKRNQKAWMLFACNCLLIMCFSAIIFPASTLRYTGFLFIGWIVAWWLFCAEQEPLKKEIRIVQGLLAIQLIGSLIMLPKDLRQPFSQLPAVNGLLNTAPPGIPIVTDYWTLNAVAAFANRSMYCIDLRKEVSFVVWGNDFALIRQQKHRYDAGIREWFRHSDQDTVCLISTVSPWQLKNLDPLFMREFHPLLIGELEGSIEKGSDLYLYQINKQ